MNKPTFAIHTLGCKVNTYESDAMAESLRKAGFDERDFTDAADVYLINTCTVTNIADRKSRQMLRRARKVNPDALIVAAGCYVDDAIKNDKLEELISDRIIDLAIPNKDKGRICELISDKLAASLSLSDEPEIIKTGSSLFLTELDGHTRAFIKVQDGCNMFCSYCIIPYVRGRLNSRPNEETLEEIRKLSENGVGETVITGIHLSSMGDQLMELLCGIEKIDGIKRVRLGSLEPTLITEKTAAVFSSFEKLCPHFHLSLQSGSDTVLKRMNRHYTAEQYEKSCDILRKYYEHPAITTDIIVGFPGETEKEFEETCSFAEKIGFYEAHVFKYSRRKGTPADVMPGQITEAVKSERSEKLIGITDRLSHGFREFYVGKETAFLSEELIEIDGISYETGYNREYVRCLKKSEKLHQNVIITGKSLQIVQQNGVDESLIIE